MLLWHFTLLSSVSFVEFELGKVCQMGRDLKIYNHETKTVTSDFVLKPVQSRVTVLLIHDI